MLPTDNLHRLGHRLAVLIAVQFFVGTGALLLPTPCQADSLAPRVWIAPIQAREGVAGAGLLAEKFDEVARGQLRRSSKIQTPEKGIMGPVSAGEADPRVERAERLRSAAKEALTAGDSKRAFKLLKAALTLYEEGLASVPKLEAVLETLGYLGSTALALGFDADAKDYFRRVVATAPDAEPLDEYSDKAKAFFAKVKKKLLRKKVGAIRIDSIPTGATLRLDGVEKGKTPQTLKKLIRGPHYIQLSHPEAGLAASIVKVRSRRTKRVKLTLTTEVGPKAPGKVSTEEIRTLMRAVHDNELDQTFRDRAHAIAELTNCSYVVVGAIGAEGNGFVLNAFVYGRHEGQVVALDRFAFRADIASTMIQAARFAKAIEKIAMAFPTDKVLSGGVFVIRAEKTVAPVPAATPPPPPVPVVTSSAAGSTSNTPTRVAKRPSENTRRPVKSKTTAATTGRRLAQPRPVPAPVTAETYQRRGQWYKSWWFWSATGVAVAGAAVGGYFLLEDDAPSGRFEVDVRW